MRNNKQEIFTLVELLIVIAIIAILASLLMPALKKARGKAKEISCASKLKQMSKSLYLYSDDSNGFLPQATTPAVKWAPQWCRQLGAYMGVRDASETSGNNADIADLQKKPYFVCPAEKELDDIACPGWGITNYAYSVWAGDYVAATSVYRTIKLAAVNNSSNKIIIMDAPGSFATSINSGWTWGYYKFANNYGNSLNLALQIAPPRHDNGTNLLYVDGHAQRKNRNEIDPQEFNVSGDGVE